MAADEAAAKEEAEVQRDVRELLTLVLVELRVQTAIMAEVFEVDDVDAIRETIKEEGGT